MGQVQRPQRNSQNELEIMQLIIEAHPVLKNKVLAKIRDIKSSFNTNALEEMAQKQEEIKGKKQRAKKAALK